MQTTSATPERRRVLKSWFKRSQQRSRSGMPRDYLAEREQAAKAQYGDQHWVCPLGHIWMLLMAHGIDNSPCGRADQIRWELQEKISKAGAA